MTSQHNPFDLDRIKSESPVNDLYYFSSCASTNTEALNWARGHDCDNSKSLPALFITPSQTAGRGRGSHSWYSNDGALTFSLLTYVSRQNAVALAARVGLAICDAVDRVIAPHSSLACQLKWPNDVFVDGKKLGGILIESPESRVFVIGIGLNVNNSTASLPEMVSNESISIIDTIGSPADINGLLVNIIQLVHEKTTMDGSNPIDISAAWQQRCMFYSTTVCLDSGSGLVTGLCHGIDSNGAILIGVNDGIVPFVNGTIRPV